ncbi:MAG: OPT/YSL family transporter [Hyphomicrobiaceae bacterium]|nr:OPT/YSL family transporter [Hyphomicrobiaceae bacterium]
MGAKQTSANSAAGVETTGSAAISPELTVRAILTGMVIGALLTPCNVYSGLKIGWAFNMSVAAGLIAFGIWTGLSRAFGARRLEILENNINQTTASSAASIISSGLAAPIPALAMLTGQVLPWAWLAIWLFAVSAVGVVVAAGLRQQLLVREHLAFPSGVATAATMRQIHGAAGDARDRLWLLVGGAATAAALKLVVEFVYAVPRWAPAIAIPFGAGGRPATLANLGLQFDPSLLMVGFGAIAGLRIGVSMLFGALLAWGLLAPLALDRGWANQGEATANASWFAPLVEWLLWPGATLMVVAALTSFAFSMASVVRQRRALRARDADAAAESASDASAVFGHVSARAIGISRAGMATALVMVLFLATLAQIELFAIHWAEAVLAVLLSYVLAIAAARVSGETGITPVGALGKITQLSFGAISPGNMTANLMTANVTGGAAGQCADLMHDLRTGQIIGATPRFQIIAQVFGVMTGSLAGAAAYLLLIPDPRSMLITPEWPAPAVATWKAVAEVLASGAGALPPAAAAAMAVAAVAGVAFAVAERVLPEGYRRLVPSATAIGLAFCIPAWNSISLFLGALAAHLVTLAAPRWAEHRIVVLAAGLVVGESLAGVAAALATIFR